VAWDLLNSYSRLGDSRGGAAASVGDTTSGTELARKTLELGAVVEAASPDARRLDSLFGLYARQVSVFQEARQPELQRQTIDRLLRLAPQLRPIRQAQAWKELARHFDDRGSPLESVEAFERAAATLHGLADEQSAEELTTTLVGLGRAQAKAAKVREAVETLTEAVRRAEISRSANPRNLRIARQVYWGRIALGDALASPLAFNLGRTADGVKQYQLARRIAEDLSNADPANEAAKVDLARALTRAGVALAEAEPARSLALLERAHSLSVKACSDCFPGLDCRMAYFTASVDPLIRLGQIERAGIHLEEARRVAEQLRRGGEVANENGLFRAEAMVLHATGRAKEALAVAQKNLAFLDGRRTGVQGPDFATIELLERMCIYAAGVDAAAHDYAKARLAQQRAGLSAI
jgi:tetratricopeptide (TPR) repeat protein